VRSPTPRRPLFVVIAVLCLAAVGMALLSQHAFDMQPCPWCVLQRLIFVAIAALALLGAAWHSAFGQRFSAAAMLLLGLGGIAAALWQHFVAASSSSCDQTLADRIVSGLGLDGALPDIFQPRASCADAAVNLLGVPHEFWSLAMFALVALVSARIVRRPAG
jgi:disulfide bond formation protein DsbB